MIRVLIFLMSSICFASVTGVVVDQRGLPVEGVTIEVELDSSNYTSDSLGRFEIDLDELVSSKILKLESPGASKHYNVNGQIQNPNMAEGVYLSKNKEQMIKKKILKSSETAVARLKFSKVGYLDTLINVDSLNQNLGDVELRDDVKFFTDQLDSLLYHYDSLYYDRQLNELLWQLYGDTLLSVSDTIIDLEYFKIEYVPRLNEIQDDGVFLAGFIRVTSRVEFGTCSTGNTWSSMHIPDSSSSAIYRDDDCLTRSAREESFYESSQRGVRSVESFFIKYDSLKIDMYLKDLEQIFIEFPDSIPNLRNEMSYAEFNPRIQEFLNSGEDWVFRNDSVIFEVDTNLMSDQNCSGPLTYVYVFADSVESGFSKFQNPEDYQVQFCKNRTDTLNSSVLKSYPLRVFSSMINEYRVVEEMFYDFRKTTYLFEKYKGTLAEPSWYVGIPNSHFFMYVKFINFSDWETELIITSMVYKENCPNTSSMEVKFNPTNYKLDVVDEATACPEMLEMVDRVNNRPL